MKNVVYLGSLLVLLILITGLLLEGRADTMSMPQMVSVSVLLGVYAVAMSMIGEGKARDERELSHRYTANRLALVSGTLVLSAGVLVQLYAHALDFWLLGGLIAINLVKIVSLVYSSHRR